MFNQKIKIKKLWQNLIKPFLTATHRMLRNPQLALKVMRIVVGGHS